MMARVSVAYLKKWKIFQFFPRTKLKLNIFPRNNSVYYSVKIKTSNSKDNTFTR